MELNLRERETQYSKIMEVIPETHASCQLWVLEQVVKWIVVKVAEWVVAKVERAL